MRTVLQHGWPPGPAACGLDAPASVSVEGGIARLGGGNICASAAAGEPLMQRYGGEMTRRPYPPAWSPAGAALAFVEVVCGERTAILTTSALALDLATVVGRDGSGLTRLTIEPTAFDYSVSCGR
jgi:hypothetical protein